MPESSPIEVRVPHNGVAFAESIHAKDFRMPERSESFHKLLFVASGHISLEWVRAEEKGVTEGGRGFLWVIPAGMRHRVIDIQPSVLLLLCIEKRFLRDESIQALWKHLEGLAGKPVFIGPAIKDARNWWRRVILEGAGDRIGRQASQRAVALQLLVAIARIEMPHHSASAERIRHLRQRVEELLYERWTLESAAATACLSRRQFSKHFRAETGQSFVEFLTTKRLDYVEHLLRGGQSTVTGAAFSAGFEDLSHFYRLFRRRTGMSPLAWLARESLR